MNLTSSLLLLGLVTVWGGSFLMIPVVIIFEDLPELTMSSHVWVSLLALAVLSTAVAYLLYFEILVRAGSANLMLVTLLIPPIAIALAVVFLGEAIGYEAWVGFGLIALGLAITDGRLMARFTSC